MQSTVPFRFAGATTPLILVPTVVNGQGPQEFLLDTGASQCLLTEHLADLLQIPRGTIYEATGAGGPVRIASSPLDSVCVGTMVREHLASGIADLQPLSTILGTPIAGNLGHNFFVGMRLTLDYQARTLILTDDIEQVSEEAGEAVARIPFRIAHPQAPLLLLAGWVNGKGPYTFVLDTGASATVFAPKLAQEVGVSVSPGEMVVGANATGAAAMGMIQSLAFGPMEQRDLTIAVADIFDPLIQRTGTPLDGIIGYDYLHIYRVTIDYITEAVLLIRYGEPITSIPMDPATPTS